MAKDDSNTRGEFRFIAEIRQKYGLERVGDDCAVLPKDHETDLLVTADMLVEEIDFRLDWTTPEFLGHKALAVSLSDVAAMGGRPEFALLSIAAPHEAWNSDLLERFYEGWHSLAEGIGVTLIGGDISRTVDKIVFDSIVLGSVPKGRAILRSGARPGDAVFVSGFLGASAGGLKMLMEGTMVNEQTDSRKDEMLLAHIRPDAQTQLGIALCETGAVTSMIDISDGLSSDIGHICESSRVGARLIADNIPIHPAVRRMFSESGQALELALHGGEDFALLFTADEKKISADILAKVHRIGEVTANVGIIELVSGGEASILEAGGFQHFR